MLEEEKDDLVSFLQNVLEKVKIAEDMNEKWGVGDALESARCYLEDKINELQLLKF